MVTMLEHGRYVIRAGLAGGRARALAFCRPPTRRKGQVAEAEGATVEAAVEALRAVLNERDRAEREGRRKCRENGVFVPSVAAFRGALQELSLSKAELAMLTAHAKAGAAGLSSQKIAEAGGYATFTVANSQYGKLARRFAELLSIGPIPPVGGYGEGYDGPGEGTAVTSAIAYGGDRDNGAFVWVMHEELREAVRLEGSV